MAAEPPQRPDKASLTGRGAFGERIVQQHDEAVKHKCPLYPDGHLSIEIIGRSGCGKTHLLLSIIPQIANLKQVFLASLIVGNKVNDSLERWCEANDIDYTFSSDPQEAAQLLSALVQAKNPEDGGVIIMDDFSSQKGGRADPYNAFQQQVAAMMRNYGYHTIVITQSATNVPTIVRNNVNMRFVFGMNDKYAVQSIRQDAASIGAFPNPEDFNEVYDLVRKDPHGYLMMVTSGAKSKSYIWLSEFGPDSEPKELLPHIDVDLRSDQTLAQLIARLAKIPARDHSPYASGQRRDIKKMILHHVYSLARTAGTDPGALLAEAEQLFDLEL